MFLKTEFHSQYFASTQQESQLKKGHHLTKFAGRNFEHHSKEYKPACNGKGETLVATVKCRKLGENQPRSKRVRQYEDTCWSTTGSNCCVHVLRIFFLRARTVASMAKETRFFFLK